MTTIGDIKEAKELINQKIAAHLGAVERGERQENTQWHDLLHLMHVQLTEHADALYGVDSKEHIKNEHFLKVLTDLTVVTALGEASDAEIDKLPAHIKQYIMEIIPAYPLSKCIDNIYAKELSITRCFAPNHIEWMWEGIDLLKDKCEIAFKDVDDPLVVEMCQKADEFLYGGLDVAASFAVILGGLVNKLTNSVKECKIYEDAKICCYLFKRTCTFGLYGLITHAYPHNTAEHKQGNKDFYKMAYCILWVEILFNSLEAGPSTPKDMVKLLQLADENGEDIFADRDKLTLDSEAYLRVFLPMIQGVFAHLEEIHLYFKPNKTPTSIH